MEKLLAWPVPSQNEVHIAMPWNDELSLGRITLHDAAGREVYSASTQGNQHTIPLNALPPGIYSVLYTDPNRVALVRVQKE